MRWPSKLTTISSLTCADRDMAIALDFKMTAGRFCKAEGICLLLGQDLRKGVLLQFKKGKGVKEAMEQRPNAKQLKGQRTEKKTRKQEAKSKTKRQGQKKKKTVASEPSAFVWQVGPLKRSRLCKSKQAEYNKMKWQQQSCG